MSSEIPVFLIPMTERAAPELAEAEDAQKLVPGHWWTNPTAHGILVATSGNFWHVWAMDQVAAHFNLPTLAFVQQEASWLIREELAELERELAVLRRAFVSGDVYADPWAVRFDREDSNRTAFENARVMLDVPVEDTSENFFAFFKSLEDRVSYALRNNLNLLHFRYLY